MQSVWKTTFPLALMRAGVTQLLYLLIDKDTILAMIRPSLGSLSQTDKVSEASHSQQISRSMI
jgi:hypothetical protein